jgi:hypothetical protein
MGAAPDHPDRAVRVHGGRSNAVVFPSVTSAPLFPLAFRVREGPGCAVPFFCLEVARSIGRAVRFAFQVVCLEDGGPAANRWWPTDGDSIAISDNDKGLQEGSYPCFGPMIEMTSHGHKAAYFGRLETPCSPS